MSSNNAAIIEVERKIKDRHTKLESLEQKKRDIDAELPQVKQDLEALNRTLSILGGSKQKKPVEQKVLDTNILGLIVPGSQTDIARKVLLEHGHALPMPVLFGKAVEIKPGLNKQSFGSNVYRLNSEGKVFKVDDKRIALLEWESGKKSNSELPLN